MTYICSASPEVLRTRFFPSIPTRVWFSKRGRSTLLFQFIDIGRSFPFEDFQNEILPRCDTVLP